MVLAYIGTFKKFLMLIHHGRENLEVVSLENTTHEFISRYLEMEIHVPPVLSDNSSLTKLFIEL